MALILTVFVPDRKGDVLVTQYSMQGYIWVKKLSFWLKIEKL